MFLLNQSIFSQNIMYSEDFESGSLPNLVRKILRYPDIPEVVSSDVQVPQAFPPPSGKFAVRSQDKNKKYFGLGSIVAGPDIDLTNPATTNCSIEAKLFLMTSGESTNNNVALLAISDFGKIESYYRFGYSNSSLYFQSFNGSTFTESLHDPDLGKSLTVPGWHTFTMRFSNSFQINFFVDGKETAFSPLIQKELTKIQVGALMWDKDGANPLFVDDFKIINFGDNAMSAPIEFLKNDVSPFNENKTFTPGQQTQPSALKQTTINWLTDLQETGRLANQSNKKILIYFYSSGQQICSKLEQETLNNPQTAQLFSKFVTCKIDAVANKDFADKLEIFKLPTLILVDINLQIYWRKIGFCLPQDLQNLQHYK